MPAPTSQPRTLYDKVFDDHVVYSGEGDTLLYIDRHLVHEVTSPQAFEGLRNAGRQVRRTDCTLATVDHNIPYVALHGSRRTVEADATLTAQSQERLSRVSTRSLGSLIVEHNVLLSRIMSKSLA